MYQRPREQEKVPAGNDEFCFIALCTKESRMFLFRNRINGLSVKTANVSESLFKISKF